MNEWNFKEWLSCNLDFDNDYFMEAFSQSEIESVAPLNGMWKPALDQSSPNHEFYFDAPSDPKKMCRGRPCYQLIITTDYGGQEDDVIHISFKHAETYYGDRFKQDATSEEKALQEKIGKEVMRFILYGIGQYIKKWKPARMEWGAVAKSSTEQNPEARKKVYKLWATRNLFPHLYVPIDDQIWLRRDLYDQHFVPGGFPKIPEESNSIGLKGKLVNDIISHATNNYDSTYEISRKITREMERRAEERHTAVEREQIRNLNTRNLQIGDKIVVTAGFSEGEIGDILSLYVDRWEGLMVSVTTINGDNETFKYQNVEKATEEKIQAAHAAMEEFIRSHNPEGFKVGDRVLWMDSGGNFAKCVITGFRREYDYHGAPPELKVKIKVDSDYDYNVNAKELKRDTPENEEKAALYQKYTKLQNEFYQLKYASNEWRYYQSEWSRPQNQEILNSEEHNPKKLKLGDQVTYSAGRYGTKTGVIINFEFYTNLYCIIHDYTGHDGSSTRDADKVTPTGVSMINAVEETERKLAEMAQKLTGWIPEQSSY